MQVDDGDWVEARLGDVLSDETWREWMVEWDASPGNHTARVRATDGTGETQTSDKARRRPRRRHRLALPPLQGQRLTSVPPRTCVDSSAKTRNVLRKFGGEATRADV